MLQVANNLQIAKEVLTFTSERKARKEAHTAVKKTDEALKYLKDETDATKKHNRRAAQSRRFIEKQNKGILAILEKKNFGGGTGGGGQGAGRSQQNASNGSTNTGSGGGGACDSNTVSERAGANGGSGLVIVRYDVTNL